jgi:phosphonoacetaldehyde hydrolase
MIFETMKQLGVYPVEAVVKVGDTVPDIQAGLNAGVWTVGVAQTGNEIGLSLLEWQALAEDEKRCKLNKARATLSQAGAHYVINSIAELPAVVEAINRHLVAG